MLIGDPQELLRPLSAETRRELEAVFTKLRRGGDAVVGANRLAAAVDKILVEDERSSGIATGTKHVS
jgi:hypothetical protein